MDNNRFSSFFGGNADKWIGGFIGLILALVVLEFGILRTIFILACVGVGVYFGSKTERDFPDWCRNCFPITNKC